ncbi:uncharacterized protein LOC110856596 [Folsomia candida]|uniref:Uncharacterized protein n=1 Tax=Folsomia candida TaxID=158441 RepID=A0A226DLD1_FOLCA|nr:uncharacterized protein LOC110856596 [Folsomia candida]OXA45930.1 hypothetical protein Fcan01_19026 [Folsomia candida]
MEQFSVFGKVAVFLSIFVVMSMANTIRSDPNRNDTETTTTTTNNTDILSPFRPMGTRPTPIELGGTTTTATTTTTEKLDATIDRVNNGVSTILEGVMSLDLAKILRGAFIFPKSNKVKSVANNVIDTIFGPEVSTNNSVILP